MAQDIDKLSQELEKDSPRSPGKYCPFCGGRGATEEIITGAQGLTIRLVNCYRCIGTGLVSQMCIPKSKKEPTPHAWIYPSPIEARCTECGITAFTQKIHEDNEKSPAPEERENKAETPRGPEPDGAQEPPQSDPG